MKNNRGFSLLSVEGIEKAVEGDYDAMEAVLQRYTDISSVFQNQMWTRSNAYEQS